LPTGVTNGQYTKSFALETNIVQLKLRNVLAEIKKISIRFDFETVQVDSLDVPKCFQGHFVSAMFVGVWLNFIFAK